MTPNQHLARAIKIAGSQGKLAKAAGCSQNAICQSLKRGRVSANLAVAIEEATGREVTRGQLRPDLWPTEAAA